MHAVTVHTIPADHLDSIVVSTEKYSSYVHVWCDKCEAYIGRWVKEKPLSYVIDLITEHGCGPLGDS